MLRPDLVVTAVHAPEQTLSTRPVDVVADIAELNTDTGATATMTLMLGPTPLAAAKTVTVAAGSTEAVTFKGVKLEKAMTAELTVRVENAAPFETDATNNARSRTIEVTENELVRANVLVDALGGYGAQFNQHVYAPVTNPPAAIAAGHGGEGQGARAAARPHLLQRRLRGAAAEPSAQPGVLRRHRPACPRGRRHDQHHLPGGQRRQDEARRSDDDLRGRPREAGRGRRLHECPLGDGGERAELHRADDGAVRDAEPRARRPTRRPRPA